MMKSNRTKYLMLLLVVSIWGLVVYRFLTYRTDGALSDQVTTNQNFDISQKSGDTFTLALNYADPFYSHTPERSTAGDNPQTAEKPAEKARVVIEPPKPRIVWPAVLYKGVVLNEKHNSNSVIIIINGSTQILKKGDEVQGVRVISIGKDSIALRFSNQQRFFKIYEK